jgi:hypothetical protein
MMISRSQGHKLVGLLEDSICAREMVLIPILAAGQDGATERAPIADLYRTLLVTFYSASEYLAEVQLSTTSAREVLHGQTIFEAGNRSGDQGHLA